MPSQTRKHRGYATQRLVADFFGYRGWPFAESTGAGRSGVDITGMPGLSAEVKATAGDVTGALVQAHRNRGEGLPFVVWRPNGYGPERVEQWPVIMRLDDFTNLLHSAGYGTPEIAEPEHEQGDVPDDGRNDDPWGSPGDIFADGPCGRCGRDPALGLASLFDPERGELWFCHPDNPALPDCYSLSSTDPPQPAPVGCPGEPDCVIGSTGHTHFIHPPVTP